MNFFAHYYWSIVKIDCREKKKEALTEQHINAITQQIKELKERKACNSESSRTNESKLDELKTELEVSREKFKELEKTREEKLSKVLKEHKEQLQEHDSIVKAQSAEINKCTKIINEFREKAAMIEVYD
eukprot:TRINITY_DN22989_c0_g1_i1.p3 TRINITY_DN22989_c0_g1~~TRINITY_DN22989_c0_g1_i1.p3  ORF type:complete len:129 (-),score=48.45 TRINITY_DN22989_c0_g1_i1:449-835(-)